MRPARTQESQETRRARAAAGRDRVLLHPRQPGRPARRYGTWILRPPGDGPDLRVTLDPLTTDPCDHRHQARGHDPGARLRHLAQIRHATCTGPMCRRPSARADFEHNAPYEQGGLSCLCNTGPQCNR